MADSADPPVVVESHDGWVHLRLNRPAVKNALNVALADSLRAEIEGVGPEVQAVLLSGSGGGFCSGLDLTAVKAGEPIGDALRALHRALYTLPVPLVGALERFAINAGTALALACDYLVAGEGSFLQTSEIRMGLGIPMNAAWMRLRLSESAAMRIALLGDRFAADDALRLGIVTETAADDRVLERAAAICDSIAACGPAGPRAVKASILATRPRTVDEWLPDSPTPTIEPRSQR